jgi:hypothetical protein
VQTKLQTEKETQKSLRGLEKQVRELGQWQRDRRNWLSHWAALSTLLPGAEEAYITGLKSAESGGEMSLSFGVKARDSKIITDLGDRLAEVGYKFKPGGVTTTSDPYGYPYSAEIRVFVEPNMPLDLTQVGPATRPADDDSIRQLARRGAAVRAPASPTATSPPSSPATASPPSSRTGRGSSSDSSADRRLTAEVEQELRKAILARYDRDRDGKLDRSERFRAYEYIRRSRYLRYFDEDRDGRLDRDEYNRIRNVLAGESR